MTIVLDPQLLQRDYCLASGNEYIGAASVDSLPKNVEDFFNAYDGCAFE